MRRTTTIILILILIQLVSVFMFFWGSPPSFTMPNSPSSPLPSPLHPDKPIIFPNKPSLNQNFQFHRDNLDNTNIKSNDNHNNNNNNESNNKNKNNSDNNNLIEITQNTIENPTSPTTSSISQEPDSVYVPQPRPVKNPTFMEEEEEYNSENFKTPTTQVARKECQAVTYKLNALTEIWDSFVFFNETAIGFAGPLTGRYSNLVCSFPSGQETNMEGPLGAGSYLWAGVILCKIPDVDKNLLRELKGINIQVRNADSKQGMPIFVCTNSHDKKHYLSACTMYRNDDVVIQEWIEWMLHVGVEHFYLYDHNSGDNSNLILKPYIDAGVVTYINWREHRPAPHSIETYHRAQDSAYVDCVNRYRDYSEWIWLGDNDEFLYPLTKKGQTVFGWKGGSDAISSPLSFSGKEDPFKKIVTLPPPENLPTNFDDLDDSVIPFLKHYEPLTDRMPEVGGIRVGTFLYEDDAQNPLPLIRDPDGDTYLVEPYFLNKTFTEKYQFAFQRAITHKVFVRPKNVKTCGIHEVLNPNKQIEADPEFIRALHFRVQRYGRDKALQPLTYDPVPFQRFGKQLKQLLIEKGWPNKEYKPREIVSETNEQNKNKKT